MFSGGNRLRIFSGSSIRKEKMKHNRQQLHIIKQKKKKKEMIVGRKCKYIILTKYKYFIINTRTCIWIKNTDV